MPLSVDSSKANIAGAVYLASLIIASRRLSYNLSSAWPVWALGQGVEGRLAAPAGSKLQGALFYIRALADNKAGRMT